MKLNLLIIFVGTIFIAQIVTWFQLNAQFLNPKFKDNPWLLLSGIPITWLYLKATSLGVNAFEGQMWPQRLISFASGILIFTAMTYFVMGESINLKNLICLLLAFCIILIQIFVK
jgi:hypothetical protein